MNRAAAITAARAGAEKLWAGTVVIHPDAKTGAHHHGPLESVIYASSAAVRECGGARGSSSWPRPAPAISSTSLRSRRPGDQRKPGRPLSCVVVRSGQDPVVVNLDLPAVEPNPEQVHWVDDIHREP